MILNQTAHSQYSEAVKERVITKIISIDSLKQIQYLEDLLDGFPKDEYYIIYCQVTRSGKGYLTTTLKFSNNKNNRNNTKLSQYRAPVFESLFDIPDRPIKPGQKLLFDHISIRKFHDTEGSESYPSLELYITN